MIEHRTSLQQPPSNIRKSTPEESFPQDINQLRHHIMEQLTTVLEGQTRTRIFASSIIKMISRVHSEILNTLDGCMARTENPDISETLSASKLKCQCLQSAFQSLINQRQRQWRENSFYLQEIIEEFSQTTTYLSSALIEKDLFERQSNVLANIILSHEKISQWQEFLLEILRGFHAIFPFNFFCIVFAETSDISLSFYYTRNFTETERNAIKNKMTGEVLSQLELADDTAVDFEEFFIENSSKSINLEHLKLITVSVPDHTPGLSGILSVAFASPTSRTPQEQDIIRSLLSVMVIIFGSSKVLNHTLSELEYYSNHDPLTGIHNRRYFNDMLEYEIGRSERHQHTFSILQLDLDDFKEINDSYGHPAGDDVLIQIAETIRSCLRKGDIAVRMGGDEFALILPETPPSGAKKVAETLKEALQTLIFEIIPGNRFCVTTSIGIASYPKDARTLDDLMSGVDSSLYRAKGLGKNEVCEFDPIVNYAQSVRDNRNFVEELRQALKEYKITPFFQPIFDCKTGEIFAYESMARLLLEDGKTLPASRFIETIEKYSLGRELDRIIVQKVIDTNKMLMADGVKPKRLFINLSAQEIYGRGILGYAEELCNLYQVPPDSIVFEILERDAIGDISHMAGFLKKLRKSGFAFALDDFGSGYNSFHYLRELHFEYVKIDGAFVRSIVDSKIDRSLVANLSNLCKDLGILTIGEFVENVEILNVLKEIGVNYAQGFYLGMPESGFKGVTRN